MVGLRVCTRGSESTKSLGQRGNIGMFVTHYIRHLLAHELKQKTREPPLP